MAKPLTDAMSAPTTTLVGSMFLAVAGCELWRPNDWRISCRPSSPRPHKPSFLSALKEGAARVEPLAGPACRLHARVRQRPSAPTGPSGGQAGEGAYDGIYLLCDSNKQSACQSAIFTRKRCIIGFILSAKYSGISSVGAFLD